VAARRVAFTDSSRTPRTLSVNVPAKDAAKFLPYLDFYLLITPVQRPDGEVVHTVFEEDTLTSSIEASTAQLLVVDRRSTHILYRAVF